MHLIYDGVNDAFSGIVRGIHDGSIHTVRTTSRNGDVLQIPEPVIITYRKPTQRVLFNAARDANPFMHLYEAMWMIAGRNDVAPLAYYAKNMLNYSDDGKVLNGAYGYRWRQQSIPEPSKLGEEREFKTIDQLSVIINHLKHAPDSRRAVLQMWNVEDDLLRIGGELFPGEVNYSGSKDVCCNLSVLFSLREDMETARTVLDMTVFNRSNDLIWGTLGANAVHFSMLQEYMACSLGVNVGEYHQISNNQHVYLSNWKPEEWLDATTKTYEIYPHGQEVFTTDFHKKDYPDISGPIYVPLVDDREKFDKELIDRFVGNYCGRGQEIRDFEEPFLQNVAQPMCLAFYNHKRRDYDAALAIIESVEAPDWRKAGEEWLLRREANYKEKKV